MKDKSVQRRIKNQKESRIPSLNELENELNRVLYREKYKKILGSTIALLIVASSVTVLLVTLFMPVMRVYGNSMSPTLEQGEIVMFVKSNQFRTGDMIAFYYNNKILIKRVIAKSGDWVDIAENGTVSVNGKILNEPYIADIDSGESSIEFPYQIPADRIFVMGDHRSVSMDSRNSQIGSIAEEQIVGKLKFRVWPIQRICWF